MREGRFCRFQRGAAGLADFTWPSDRDTAAAPQADHRAQLGGMLFRIADDNGGFLRPDLRPHHLLERIDGHRLGVFPWRRSSHRAAGRSGRCWRRPAPDRRPARPGRRYAGLRRSWPFSQLGGGETGSLRRRTSSQSVSASDSAVTSLRTAAWAANQPELLRRLKPDCAP